MPFDRRAVALYAFMLLSGLAMASWVTRTPSIRDQLSASPADMGMIFFGLSVGSLIGIISAGHLTSALGTKAVLSASTAAMALATPSIGVSTSLESALAVATSLLIFGLGVGGIGVALDVEGAKIESLSAKPFLTFLHGFNSLGILLGAALGALLNASNVPVAWHLTFIGFVVIITYATLIKSVPPKAAEKTGLQHSKTSISTASWFDYRLLAVGFIALSMALAEGAANDWVPLVMVDGHGFNEASSALIFTGFGLAMMAGRFCGPWFISRYGTVKIFSISALVGAIGIALVILAPSPPVAGTAIILWGLGTSLAFPMAISAAGRNQSNSSKRVSFVTALGYVALLVGPPLLGFIAEHSGLKTALIVPLVFVILTLALLPVISTGTYSKLNKVDQTR